MNTPHATGLTVTKSDIAALAGVGRSTVSNWTSRHHDFPTPVAGTSASPRYDEAEIRAWLEENGKKVKDLPADRLLWGAMDSWRGIASPDELGEVASALLTWRYVSDPTSSGFDHSLPPDSLWPALRQSHAGDRLVALIRQGMSAYETIHPERGPLFGSTTVGRGASAWNQLASRPDALLGFMDALSTIGPTRIGVAFEAFQDRLTHSARRGYDEFASSATLVELVAEVAKSVPGPVHDPAAGSGRMLLAVGRKGEGRTVLTGQDISAAACAHANQRALVTGRDNVTVRLGDVFTTDFFERGCAQVVAMDPPYGISHPDADRLLLDPRLPYGPPPKSSLDTAWLQIALWYLGKNGRAFVLQPRASAFQGGPAGRVRRAMLEAGTVEALVALPGGLASNTQIPLNLWVLARPGETADRARVLLIDHSRTGDIDIPAIAAELQSWRDHQVVPNTSSAGAYTVGDLVADHADLSPSRWLATTDGAPDLKAVRDQIEAVHRAVTALQQLGRLTPASLEPSDETPRMVTVPDLEKSGALRVLRSTERIQESDQTHKGTPVVTGTWIRGGEDSKWVNMSILERDPIITQPGDVLVQNTGGLAARVDDEGGRVLLSPSFLLLRPVTEDFDPRYLAAMIVTKRNAGAAQGTAIQRIRIQDVKIPLLTRVDQQRVVTRLGEIRNLQAAARAVLEDATKVRDNLVEAIAAGTIRVGAE